MQQEEEEQDPWGAYTPEEEAEFERITRKTPLRELRSLPEDELVRRHGVLYQSPQWHMKLTPDDYLNELTRREGQRQNHRLERLTSVIAALTVALVALEVLPRILGAEH